MPQRADQLNLVRWENQDPMPWEASESRTSSSRRTRTTKTESSLDKLTLFALGLVFVGLVFSVIGFFYPVDLQRESGASARENEKLDKDYMELVSALHAVVIAGMILIGLGGLILAAIFTNTVLCEECRQGSPDSPDDNHHSNSLSLQTSGSRPDQAVPQPTENYGTVTAGIGGY